ncbi:response regulator [Paenibacillus sp. N3.4]|uniref:response regulator n=1 Tax=Paenibacillus sp. N3.4 TaxID=2603222 RepID=UPI0011CBA418|nr:response regulator [Paenibacillus sp. N3.4]TXK78380.1 response regulator [Paenibacillus sp. N3.4]
MYKLVIIDDEPAVRNGLSNYFDWGAFGIELVGQADDGDTGLEMIGRVKPTIVLTDVKMPSMDGIEMSKEIRMRYPGMKIVFVSGHNDADYLRSALQIHAIDYIFKPVKMAELRKVIERVVQDLRSEEKERRLVQDMQVKLTQSMPLLQEKFLISVIRDGVAKMEDLQDKLDFLNLEMPIESIYIAFVVTIDDSAEVLNKGSERDKQLLSYAILNVIQELIDTHMKGYAFENRPGEYVGILILNERAEDREALLFMLAEAIRDNLLQWLKISVTIGVGEQVLNIGYLPSSYKLAREAADQKWYLGKNRIITMDSLETGEERLGRFDAEEYERVITALKAGDHVRMDTELNDIFQSLGRNRKDGYKYCRNLCLQLILLSGRVLLDLNVLTKEWDAKEEEAMEQVPKQETMEDLRRYIASYLRGVCSCVQEKRNGKSNNVIERVRHFIEERYPDNLTVANIAEGVYLSQTYVSLLFKQETGETIYEYLTKIRIEKAKELLHDPRNKFYEVCEAVGYSDPSHFSKLFKKITGLTPSMYRNQNI